MLSGKIVSALDDSSVYMFIKSYDLDLDQKSNEYGIPKTNIIALFNNLEHEIPQNDIKQFLINEFSYGKLRHVFVNFIESTMITDINDVISRIKRLNDDGFRIKQNIKDVEFSDNMRVGLDIGERIVAYYKIMHTNSNIEKIEIILAEGIEIKDGDRVNNYIFVVLNLIDKYMTISLRNWHKNSSEKNNTERIYDIIKPILLGKFGIILNRDSARYYNTIYKMLDDQAELVLNDSVSEIDQKIGNSIDSCLEGWWNSIFNNRIRDAEKKILKKQIVNNFLKNYINSKYGILLRDNLIKDFGLKGYPFRVQFTDDTIAKGRIKSSDPNESVFSTAVFYDLKARLDHSKQIDYTTLYWFGDNKSNDFNFSIHLNKQDLFKIVFYPHYIGKEMYNNVLCEITSNFTS